MKLLIILMTVLVTAAGIGETGTKEGHRKKEPIVLYCFCKIPCRDIY